MKITRIVILNENEGTDLVFLYTDLPPAVWTPREELELARLQLKFEVMKGRATAYVAQYFPRIPVATVNAKTGERKDYV